MFIQVRTVSSVIRIYKDCSTNSKQELLGEFLNSCKVFRKIYENMYSFLRYRVRVPLFNNTSHFFGFKFLSYK